MNSKYDVKHLSVDVTFGVIVKKFEKYEVIGKFVNYEGDSLFINCIVCDSCETIDEV